MSTEREMLDRLHVRYNDMRGNGERYVRAEHVRNAAGFRATRTADFIALDLWPSAGLRFHGHEVKVSRSDWLSELKDPDKADAFKRYMDYWWLVVPSADIVRDDLPDDWGLIVNDRIAKQAPLLKPAPMPHTMTACLLRAVHKTTTRSLAWPLPS